MGDIHDPRTWHWGLGMPETLKDSIKIGVKDEKGKIVAHRILTIRHNADNTITVRADNYMESVEVTGKSDPELFEAVKYAVICASFEWTDEIEGLVRSELGK